MDPTIWGPHLWFFMHTVSFNYPKNPTQEDRDHNYNFFYNLTKIIPCEKCKTHYKDFFNKHSILNYLDKRDKLIEWVVKCHNNVNKLTNKPEWSLEKVFDHYQNIFLNKSSSNNWIFKQLLICFVVLIILFIIKKYI